MGTRYRPFRVWMFVPMFVLLAVFAAVPAQTASAQMVACRTDPIVFFKDGTKVTLMAEIGTDISDVRGVLYVLHAPRGSEVAHVVFTANALGGRETIVVYFDNYAGKYSSRTTARAAVRATVKAHMFVDGPNGVSADGWTGQQVTLDWARTGIMGR